MSDIQFSTWVHFVDLCALPIRAELRETYDAASPYQAECIAAMWHHSAMMRPNTPDTGHNPFGIANEGSFYGLSTFPDYVTAVQVWKERGSWRYYEYREGLDTQVGQLTKAVLEHDAIPAPEPEPLPERVTQPTQYDLRNWFCSNKTLRYDERVFAQWKAMCRENNLFPELIRVTEDERGQLHHFESGLKIIATPETTGAMYFDKD